eukprot:Skav230715  [mRNA]  locus=scaffold715:187686:188705:- [translate_table: standard]
MACCCFLPTCRKCFASQPAVQSTSRQPACNCFLATCPECSGGEHFVGERKVVRKDMPTKRIKRSVQADVNWINQCARARASNHGCYKGLQPKLLTMRPSWSAMQEIGRPRGEQWDFWEVFAGCSRLTQEVRKLGGKCGPAVDCLPSAELCLDLTLPRSRALVWQLVQEARVEWLHLGLPCTFFVNLSRATALRTEAQWQEKREIALGHFEFTVHILREQDSDGRCGSMEQPKGAGSWRCRGWTELEESGHFQKYLYDSCAYGLCDEFGQPLLKPGGIGANADLSVLERYCSCVVPHGQVQGTVQQGPYKGRKRSEVAGQYTTQWCQTLAREILLGDDGA